MSTVECTLSVRLMLVYETGLRLPGCLELVEIGGNIHDFPIQAVGLPCRYTNAVSV